MLSMASWKVCAMTGVLAQALAQVLAQMQDLNRVIRDERMENTRLKQENHSSGVLHDDLQEKQTQIETLLGGVGHNIPRGPGSKRLEHSPTSGRREPSVSSSDLALIRKCPRNRERLRDGPSMHEQY